MTYGADHDEEYFARRAAQHRLLTECVGDDRARRVHLQLAGAYERFAVRAMIDRRLG